MRFNTAKKNIYAVDLSLLLPAIEEREEQKEEEISG